MPLAQTRLKDQTGSVYTLHTVCGAQITGRAEGSACARDRVMMNVSPAVNRDLCVTVRGCNGSLSLHKSLHDSMTHSAALRL